MNKLVAWVKRMAKEKREYRQMQARIKDLPNEYDFVYRKIQHYMWNYAAGDGYDMVKIQYELIDLFEAGAAEGKHVLEITGEDVAAFCDELLTNAKTYTAKWRETLNRDIRKGLGKQGDSK